MVVVAQLLFSSATNRSQLSPSVPNLDQFSPWEILSSSEDNDLGHFLICLSIATASASFGSPTLTSSDRAAAHLIRDPDLF